MKSNKVDRTGMNDDWSFAGTEIIKLAEIVAGRTMTGEGFVIVQHGDFPHDFKDKHREMFDFVEGMIAEVSQKSREIEREPDDPYLVDMSKIEECFKRIGGYQHLETGYMEFLRPTVEEAVQKLERQGVKKVILVNAPGIMMRSSHSLIDIPHILREIKRRHPNLGMVYAAPGVDFDKMADVFVKRIDCALGKRVLRTNPCPLARSVQSGG